MVDQTVLAEKKMKLKIKQLKISKKKLRGKYFLKNELEQYNMA